MFRNAGIKKVRTNKFKKSSISSISLEAIIFALDETILNANKAKKSTIRKCSLPIINCSDQNNKNIFDVILFPNKLTNINKMN
jgi:hypothetical protein